MLIKKGFDSVSLKGKGANNSDCKITAAFRAHFSQDTSKINNLRETSKRFRCARVSVAMHERGARSQVMKKLRLFVGFGGN